MCKGKFKPVLDKWLDPVASVSSNGEEVIAVYSKLKCEHGGTFHITRNGQGGLYDQGSVNFEVSKELAWAFTPFAVSGYQLYTGRNMNDWSVMTKTETGIQVAYFILDGVIVFSVGKKMFSAASKRNILIKESIIVEKANLPEKTPQIIKNRYPNESQSGKVFEHVLENGQIKIRDGIREADFIIDINGNLKVGRGHAFLSNGSDVQAAGKIKIDSFGNVRRITNESGHFAPNVEQAKNYEEIFNSLGVRTQNSWLEIYQLNFTNSGYINLNDLKIVESTKLK